MRDSGFDVKEILRVAIRREGSDDRDEIRSVTARAFAGLAFSNGTEPRIVDALREAKALELSLVAVLDEHVVGHVAFSDASPAGDSGWFALGPVSVEPRFQRRGVGSRLIDSGLAALRDAGGKGCVLVGDHRYYSRFGFIVTPGLAPAGYPAEHFQILSFSAAVPTAPPIFHPAFSMAS
jgi:predicted N-acetyltransferase YhbS